ncbi:MAG: EAL domain-containing protein, partial [Thiolinea sp.]
TSDKARDLVSAIIDIAKRFQLKTVAEGIENSEIATILQGMKCDVAQGYYWSRPVPISSILTLLQNNSQKHALPAG